MGRIIRMPSESELPPGAVRAFVEELFELYREARRPSVRHVSEAIRRNESLAGTASPETIRRMLRGLTVPAHWPTVEAVLITLCDLAGDDPDRIYTDYVSGQELSRRKDLEQAWHRALDEPVERRRPTPSATSAEESDPWATDDQGSYPDEPPF